MRQPFFPPPFRVTEYRGSTTITETPRKRRRIDVQSFVSSTNDLSTDRMEATLRLQNCWWSLVEKYSTPLDEDDEVDVFTGEVVRDRGFVRRMEGTYEIGDLLKGSYRGDGDDTGSSEDVGSVPAKPGVEGNILHPHSAEVDDEDDACEDQVALSEYEVALSEDLSEDELGLWGEGSGLDYQYRVVPPLSARLNSEDERDLEEFEEAEKALRTKFGQQYLEEDTSDDEIMEKHYPSDDEQEEERTWNSGDVTEDDDEFATYDLGEGSVVRLLDSSDESDELNSFLN